MPRSPQSPLHRDCPSPLQKEDRVDLGYMTSEKAYRIVLAGDANVGKSSFLLRLCKNEFTLNSSSTLGERWRQSLISITSFTVCGCPINLIRYLTCIYMSDILYLFSIVTCWLAPFCLFRSGFPHEDTNRWWRTCFTTTVGHSRTREVCAGVRRCKYLKREINFQEVWKCFF